MINPYDITTDMIAALTERIEQLSNALTAELRDAREGTDAYRAKVLDLFACTDHDWTGACLPIAARIKTKFNVAEIGSCIECWDALRKSRYYVWIDGRERETHTEGESFEAALLELERNLWREELSLKTEPEDDGGF